METQNLRLLRSLKAGQVIDPLFALNQLGIYRLSARIYDLSKQGIDISRGWRTVFNRYGEECRVRVYFIKKGE